MWKKKLDLNIYGKKNFNSDFKIFKESVILFYGRFLSSFHSLLILLPSQRIPPFFISKSNFYEGKTSPSFSLAKYFFL